MSIKKKKHLFIHRLQMVKFWGHKITTCLWGFSRFMASKELRDILMSYFHLGENKT